MPTVSGFANNTLLLEHFGKHNQWDFHYQNANEHLSRAKAFLEASLDDIGAEECEDEDGDIIRYSPLTEEFAVVNPPNIIRTYYKPMPIHLAPPGWPPRKIHRRPTNHEYFQGNCT